MIKRRFYRFEHDDRDAPSESSSSSSDSEVEAEATDETEDEGEDEENVVLDERQNGEASSSSGYESEDSSANEVNLDSSGLPTSDEDVVIQNGKQNLVGSFTAIEGDNVLDRPHHNPEKDGMDFDVKDCVIKCKSVFKCRLCPRIVCLSEETLKAHLNSKKHARSEKLQSEGRLKFMLNSDGQVEGDTHAENHAATMVSGLKSTEPKKKGKGRWKQRKRSRQETRPGKVRLSTEKQSKRQKSDS